MQTVNRVEAKAHLSRLVDMAKDGVSVRILRRGKVVAQLVKAEPLPKRIVVSALRSLTEAMTLQKEAAAKRPKCEGGIPPELRNQRLPTEAEIPASIPASSLERPAAILC